MPSSTAPILGADQAASVPTAVAVPMLPAVIRTGGGQSDGSTPGDTDRQSCIDLAAALRLAAHFGFDSPECAHFSVRLREGEGTARTVFAINPCDRHWSEIVADDLVVIEGGRQGDGTADGSSAEAEGRVEVGGACLHAAIHAARPDVACVLHAHSPHATALTLLQDPRLRTASQTALRFRGRIAYLTEYDGPLASAADGARIAAALGGHGVLMMANHGVVVVGASVAEAFDDLFHLEKAAQLQILAAATGVKLRRIAKPVADRAMAAAAPDAAAARRHFAALKRRFAAPDQIG